MKERKTRFIGVRVPGALARELRLLAIAEGVPQSETIRRALQQRVDTLVNGSIHSRKV